MTPFVNIIHIMSISEPKTSVTEMSLREAPKIVAMMSRTLQGFMSQGMLDSHEGEGKVSYQNCH